MTGSQAWFASAAVNLIGMSAERFTRDDFAQLLARTCAQACAGSEVGVVLVGKPTVTVGSTLHAGALEALGLRLGEGAAVDALRTRATVPEADLAEAALAEAGLDDKRWPSYAPAARQLGYQTVRSFTLLHAAEPVGVIDVFRPASAAAPLRTCCRPSLTWRRRTSPASRHSRRPAREQISWRGHSPAGC